jgi:hypothetical protein
MAKTSKYSILIICEGQNTEPHFFGSIRNEILDKNFDIGDVKITILPEPMVEDEEDDDTGFENTAKRKKLKTRAASVGDEPEVIMGIPPLKWVEEGQRELKDGTYNEVWAVFDHDNHPAREEAFKQADVEIDGKKVQIAFSSIAFEYYLLLHFERIYKIFVTSECRDKKNPDKKKRKIPIKCSSEGHADDCSGNLCIGGYARKNGHWDDSKSGASTFALVKDFLEIGFENSAWLRYVSDIRESDKEIYDRNPYITTDSIVKRLIGKNDIKWIFIPLDKKYTFNDIEISISKNHEIEIKNIGKVGIIIPLNSVSKISLVDNTREIFGERIHLEPGKIQIFDLSRYKSEQDLWFQFTYQNNRIMFEFDQSNMKSLIKSLSSLSNKELKSMIDEIKNKLSNTQI